MALHSGWQPFECLPTSPLLFVHHLSLAGAALLPKETRRCTFWPPITCRAPWPPVSWWGVCQRARQRPGPPAPAQSGPGAATAHLQGGNNNTGFINVTCSSTSLKLQHDVHVACFSTGLNTQQDSTGSQQNSQGAAVNTRQAPAAGRKAISSSGSCCGSWRHACTNNSTHLHPSCTASSAGGPAPQR